MKTFSRTLRLEVALRQNMVVRGRPETFDWNPRDPFRAVLQDVESGRRRFGVEMSAVTPVSDTWWSLLVQMTVDGRPLCEPRPGIVYGEPATLPTMAFFPSVAPETNREFGGFWTVSMQVLGA